MAIQIITDEKLISTVIFQIKEIYDESLRRIEQKPTEDWDYFDSSCEIEGKLTTLLKELGCSLYDEYWIWRISIPGQKRELICKRIESIVMRHMEEYDLNQIPLTSEQRDYKKILIAMSTMLAALIIALELDIIGTDFDPSS